MAQPTNTFDSYDSVGNREDLSDIIYNISPTETPFFNGCGRSKASAVFHEWQTDALATAVTTNAVIEGDEATMDAVTPTVRVGNRCQILDKTATVTGTQEAIDKAGRMKEMAYQVAKKSKELKRDIEATLTQNIASTAGSSTTARTLGSLEAWITTNDSRGTSGADGGYSAGVVAAATDGTQRAFTEAILKSVILQCFTSGGNPDTIMAGPFNKQAFSGISGTGVTRQAHTDDSVLVASIDAYKSDFGTFKLVPNRFQRERTVFVLDFEYWKVAYLRQFQQWPLAKTGDTEKRQIVVELTLEACNQAASGVCADLTTS